ncbi:hypothetical protein GVX82_00455 [Patescibacteria group bacterium]|jgi:Kef-type K+ transport system membrane component KefB|nr:hypothetical protein [Patescibacteria group bacterium]
MESFLPFFLLLFAGVAFSALSQKLHLPWVVALISAGVILGPQALDLVEPTPTITFLGEMGLIFLMFMAGLEVRLSELARLRHDIGVMAAVHGVATFSVGFVVGWFLGFPPILMLLLGVVFMSTSVAVVVPSLESAGLLHSTIGKSILAKSIVADLSALLILSVALEQLTASARLPLPLFYLTLVGALIALRVALPRIEVFLGKFHERADLFQQQMRAVLMVLVGTVIILELLGLHPIIAGFFAGLVLSDTIKSKVLLGKLRAISYSFFIPTFFLLVGLELNISVFFDGAPALALLALFVAVALIVKFISGWLGARLVGYSTHRGLLFGAAAIPQLSTTLAVVYTADSAGILTPALASALVGLGVVSTVLGPLLVRLMGAR